MNAKYIDASSLAKKHKVSMSTIRRRISEGRLFPGAKKSQMGFGEMWLIPSAEAKAATLADISPKLYQERRKTSSKPIRKEGDLLSVGSYEERITRLEQLYVKLASNSLERK